MDSLVEQFPSLGESMLGRKPPGYFSSSTSYSDFSDTASATSEYSVSGGAKPKAGAAASRLAAQFSDHSSGVQGIGRGLPMPETGGVPMPGRSGGPMPGTSGIPMPGTSGVPMPGTSGVPMPGRSGVLMPGTSGARCQEQVACRCQEQVVHRCQEQVACRCQEQGAYRARGVALPSECQGSPPTLRQFTSGSGSRRLRMTLLEKEWEGAPCEGPNNPVGVPYVTKTVMELVTSVSSTFFFNSREPVVFSFC
ncbi:uncharacterized protein LOC125946236 isoform X2 [Dermacentor silvarum]|uniref:uncharacterized protein LOC125946236 isoform X2 n=1 Tax=Dermacentor silvarum TaxID=543639 RepID=UPI0021015AC9|nr:uncharacterized protein LOC125946236 isoform X2 [Dermacentor silvarum]